MGHGASRHGESSTRRYKHHKSSQVNGNKPPRAIPSAYIAPPGTQYIIPSENHYVTPDGIKYIVPPGTQYVVPSENQKEATLRKHGVPNGDVEHPGISPNGDTGRPGVTSDRQNGNPEIPNETVTPPESPNDSKTQPKPAEKGDDKTDIPKTNGYVKHPKNKKGSYDHVVHKEKAYKLYEPEYVVHRDRSSTIDGSVIVSRPRSYIHYEPRRTGYAVREKGYKMREPKKYARRVAHTYGTWRHEPQVVTARSVQEVPKVVTARPVQEIPKVRPVQEVRKVREVPVPVVRPVTEIPPSKPRSEIVETRGRRVIRAVPAGPVKAQTLESPRRVIVRRTLSPSPERVLTTPAHGYIPRHTLGRYKPKVIDGYVAPSNIRERVLLDTHFSDPGGYREVIIEPMYQTRTIPPPAYEGHEKRLEKDTVEKIVTETTEQTSQRNSKNLEPEQKQSAKTDDEKLKDIPMTQYFDDGRTIMIIDYLVEPYTKITKQPQSTSTPRAPDQNGDVLLENGYEPYNDVYISDPHHRQRPAPFGDVNFLP